MTIKTILVSFFATAILAGSAFAQNSTVIVTGNTTTVENTPGGWYFNRDTSNATPISFNVGNASIGYGSLYVLPIDGVALHKFIGENYINTPITNVNHISYDFKIGSGGTSGSANQFYMNVYANFGSSNPLKFYDCRYDLVPTVGSTAGFTTVTFDPTHAYPVKTRGSSPHPCPAIPANMNVSSLGSTIRAIAINLGDTDISDQGLDGYFDKVVVSTFSGGTTTYDFEPIPTSADQCKKGGWMGFQAPVFKNQGDCIQYVNTGK